jgi:hypothetical protein
MTSSLYTHRVIYTRLVPVLGRPMEHSFSTTADAVRIHAEQLRGSFSVGAVDSWSIVDLATGAVVDQQPASA